MSSIVDIKIDLFRCVISSKSNEFKNTIDIIQSAFETNMASIETQFMAKVGTPVMFRIVSFKFESVTL